MLSFVCIVVLSWVRYIATGTLKVDGIEFGNEIGITCTFLFLLSIALNFIFFYRIYTQGGANYLRIGYFVNFAALFMLPCISNDIFSFLAYGESYTNSTVIYTQNQIADSFMKDYVSTLYTTIPCVYGILSILVAKISTLSHDLSHSILTYKFICFGFGLIMLYSLANLNKIENSKKALIALNPLWTIEALGQVHSEVLVISLFFASLYCIQIKRLKLIGYLIFWLSFLGKFSMILCFPILLYHWYKNDGFQWRTFIQILSINIFIILLLILGLASYFQNLDMIVEPLNIVNNLWPTGTFLSYFYELFKFCKLNQLAELTSLFKLLFKSLFIFYIGFLFLANREKLKTQIPEIIFSVLAAILLIYSHRFMTWYLLLLLPLFLWISDKKRVKYFLFLSAFGIFQDSAYYSQVYPLFSIIVAISIAGMIVFQFKILALPFSEHNKTLYSNL